MPKLFLYGPDSSSKRIYEKVGPLDVEGGAVLRRHRLVFDKPNLKRRGEGLPNLSPTENSLVFGIIADLDAGQLERLDGYYGGYERKSVNVVPQPTDMLGTVSMKAVTCSAYFARRTSKDLKPTKATMEATKEGAKEHRGPNVFFEELEAQEVLDG